MITAACVIAAACVITASCMIAAAYVITAACVISAACMITAACVIAAACMITAVCVIGCQGIMCVFAVAWFVAVATCVYLPHALCILQLVLSGIAILQMTWYHTSIISVVSYIYEYLSTSKCTIVV